MIRVSSQKITLSQVSNQLQSVNRLHQPLQQPSPVDVVRCKTFRRLLFNPLLICSRSLHRIHAKRLNFTCLLFLNQFHSRNLFENLNFRKKLNFQKKSNLSASTINGSFQLFRAIPSSPIRHLNLFDRL